MITPEELTATALDTSKADGCIVVLTDTSEVNLRWANSTMTTNGHSTTRSFSVISVVGDSVGVVSGNGADLDEVRAVVAASEQAAQESGSAQDVASLVQGDVDENFGEPAAATEIEVFARLTDGLAETFSGAVESGRRELFYGFADHRVETTWLASSTGLRRRWVQPTGTIAGRRERGSAFMRRPAVHRPHHVEHQVRHGRGRQDRLVPASGQLDLPL